MRMIDTSFMNSKRNFIIVIEELLNEALNELSSDDFETFKTELSEILANHE
jgi:hypothetical protein